MTLRLSALVLGVLSLTGCFTPSVPETRNWTLEWRPAVVQPAAVAKDALPSVRLSQVTVRAPYAGTRLAVLRPDGSIAFDPYNVFAAQPSALVRGAAADAIEAGGRVLKVLPSSSSAVSPFALDIVVTRLALDCREAGRREALVGLTLALVKDRGVIGVGKAEASAPTKEGDYSASFSRAFADAAFAAWRDLEANGVRK